MYRVRAKNIFCWGEWSTPDVKVQTGARPKTPLAPKTTIVKKITPGNPACKDFVTDYEVKIYWEMPNQADLDEVKYFEIRVGTGDQSVYTATKDCDGRQEAVINSRSCRVSMSMFW